MLTSQMYDGAGAKDKTKQLFTRPQTREREGKYSINLQKLQICNLKKLQKKFAPSLCQRARYSGDEARGGGGEGPVLLIFV